MQMTGQLQASDHQHPQKGLWHLLHRLLGFPVSMDIDDRAKTSAPAQGST